MSIEKIQTFTIVAGTMRCNAVCPDCVSKMTTNPKDYLALNFEEVDWANFGIAADLAAAAGANTVLITGKGEPTLYPEQVNDYLGKLNEPRYSRMAIKEMQTNGLLFRNQDFNEEGWLGRWYNNGLRVMALSVVDIEDKVNEEFYCKRGEKYPSLEETVGMLHDKGYTVRLSVTMTKGRVDSPTDIERIVDYCGKNGIEQLSFRPVRKPAGDTFCPKIASWIEDNQLTKEQEKSIADYVDANKDKVLERLMHGAVVYQYRGQNLCLTDCLTLDPEEKGYRQLIFYSNGMLAYDWASPGAVILGIGKRCREYLRGKNEQ